MKCARLGGELAKTAGCAAGEGRRSWRFANLVLKGDAAGAYGQERVVGAHEEYTD